MQHSDTTTTTARDWSEVEFTTYCPDGSGTCVQYAKLDGLVALRTTQHPDKMALLTDSEWADFVQGVRSGEIA